MSKIWIYALLLSIIVTACSDDTPNAPEESSNSSSIEIIEITPDEESSSSISRPPQNILYFSYTVEEQSSSSEASSSSLEKSSSSSQPTSSAASSSSESSSSAQSSSSNVPKSSASLFFYNCEEYDCISTEYLNPDISYGELLDKRDNQVYRTVVISNNVWMAQNMNYKIEPEEESTEASWCYNTLENCQKFGRLYNWDAALKACPEGWHLPTADEWKELLEDHSCGKTSENQEISYLCSGAELKASASWGDENEQENAFGFSVVAAGVIYNDATTALGEATFFWTSSDTLSRYPYATLFSIDDDSAIMGATEKTNGFSVRCIKGNAE